MAGMDHGSGGGMNMNMRDPKNAPGVKMGPGVQTISPMPKDRSGEPPQGLEGLDHRVLTYRDLVSLAPNPDVRAPSRQFEIHLTGNMERYMWGFDGQKLSDPADPIPFRKGERARVTLVNDTMMPHPIHLHGHFFELVTGHGNHAPRKHTVNVPPGGKMTFDLTADAPGDWAFHCHNLYHMTAGMMRVVTVRPFAGGGMNRLTAALAATTMLGIAGPVAAQSMQGMDHSAMPGMTMPMPAKKKPVVKPTAKGKPAKTRSAPARRPSASTTKRRAAPTAGMNGMDHGTMPGMDHSSMPGMDHAAPQGSQQGMEAMPGMQMPGNGQTVPQGSQQPMQGMDHSAMPGMTMPADQHSGHDMQGMSGMAGMPGMAADGVQQTGTALPAGNAPPALPTDHAADSVYGADAMAMGRHHLQQHHGGQNFSQVLLNLAEYQFRNGRDGYRWDGEAWFGVTSTASSSSLRAREPSARASRAPRCRRSIAGPLALISIYKRVSARIWGRPRNAPMRPSGWRGWHRASSS